MRNNNQISQNFSEYGFNNSYKNPNLISYENSLNLMNQNNINEKELYQNNNINNINEYNNQNIRQEKEKEENDDEPIIPERSLTDYINNEFLSDAVLKLNDIEFYFHKIILTSCSDYFNEFFTSLKNSNNNPEEIKENIENKEEAKESENKYKNKLIVNFPDIISSNFGGGNKKNSLEKIMKYCYSNQDFTSIEKDINQYNIFTLLEMAHSLGIKSLKLNLEKKIIKNYLGKDNATKLALESNIFDLKKLNKKCIDYICKNFKDVKIFKSDILDLNFDNFKNLVISDDINIDNERDVSEFVIDYIKSRRDLPDEEALKKINENNDDNNKNIEINDDNKDNEEYKENEENKENKENEENKEITEKKEEKNDVKEKWRKYLYELKESNKKKRIDKEQEKELISCIRFNYLPHSELVKLTNEPIMNDYKDLLLQALSLKLYSYEENQSNDINNKLLNSKPRNCLKAINKSMLSNTNNNINALNNNNFDITNNKSMPNPNNFYFQKKIFNNDNNNHIASNQMYKSDFYNINSNQNNNNYIDNGINNEEYNEYDKNNYYNNDDDINMYNNNNDNNSISSDEDSDNNINAQYFNINNQKEKDKINRYYNLMKPENNNSKNKSSKISQVLYNSFSSEDENKSNINQNQSNQKSNTVYYPKFKYQSDFDHNGALYFLGTRGLSKKYENPHTLKLIKAFGSSLLSGNFSDFVGRKYINLSTENEENSFFGIDLGPNRALIPTAYSLKNRDSDTNVLLCWNFQGSNDKINFEILDQRFFYSETNDKLREKTRKCRHMLKKPKTTSTWGINKKIKDKYPNGFRYFLLKQLGKNSSGNYNLTISGFEIYGIGIGSGWIFK